MRNILTSGLFAVVAAYVNPKVSLRHISGFIFAGVPAKFFLLSESVDFWQRFAALDEPDGAIEILLQTLPVRTICVSEIVSEERMLVPLAIAANRSESVPLPKARHFEDEFSEILRNISVFDHKYLNVPLETVPEPFLDILPEDWLGKVSVVPVYKDSDSTVFLLCEHTNFRISSEEWASLYEKKFEEAILALSPVIGRMIKIRSLIRKHETLESEKQAALARLGRSEVVDTVVGSETGLRLVIERVETVAPRDIPVMILGEAGTGKELIARAIHGKSPRSNQPFHRVNCGAIPQSQIEEYLFGREYEPGSDDPKTEEARKSRFEKTEGGTLFLDEIGELPVSSQLRLLNILKEGRFKRIGGERVHIANVRIIVACSQDLMLMLQESNFSEELWYLLAEFPIRIPPLRERILDIKGLSEHFARRAAKRFGLPVILPNKPELELLEQYSWPGNVRELGTVIDRAAILGNGKTLEISKSLGLKNISENTFSENLTLEELVREHIQNVLERTRGRIDGRYGAAKLLQVNPSTLRAKIRKLGINLKEFKP